MMYPKVHSARTPMTALAIADASWGELVEEAFRRAISHGPENCEKRIRGGTISRDREMSFVTSLAGFVLAFVGMTGIFIVVALSLVPDQYETTEGRVVSVGGVRNDMCIVEYAAGGKTLQAYLNTSEPCEKGQSMPVSFNKRYPHLYQHARAPWYVFSGAFGVPALILSLIGASLIMSR